MPELTNEFEDDAGTQCAECSKPINECWQPVYEMGIHIGGPVFCEPCAVREEKAEERHLNGLSFDLLKTGDELKFLKAMLDRAETADERLHHYKAMKRNKMSYVRQIHNDYKHALRVAVKNLSSKTAQIKTELRS